jgi:hypothetical protein
VISGNNDRSSNRNEMDSDDIDLNWNRDDDGRKNRHDSYNSLDSTMYPQDHKESEVFIAKSRHDVRTLLKEFLLY